jgi:hypothetical protein
MGTERSEDTRHEKWESCVIRKCNVDTISDYIYIYIYTHTHTYT